MPEHKDKKGLNWQIINNQNYLTQLSVLDSIVRKKLSDKNGYMGKLKEEDTAKQKSKTYLKKKKKSGFTKTYGK